MSPRMFGVYDNRYVLPDDGRYVFDLLNVRYLNIDRVRSRDWVPPSIMEKPTSFDDESMIVSRLYIGNTYHCNMGCTYCYNEFEGKDVKGSEVDKPILRVTMLRSIDDLFAQKTLKSAVIIFVGGEPFLESRLLTDGVAHAQRVAKEHGIKVHMAVYTNGTFLSVKVINWANENAISLVFSLDGPPAENRRRIYLDGRPSAAAVLTKLRIYTDNTTDTVRRLRSVCPPNVDLVELHEYFLALGFNEIHVQQAYGSGGQNKGDVVELERLVTWYFDKLEGGTVFSALPMHNVIDRILLKGQAVGSWFPCSAGHGALGVGADGGYYPCHHFMEEGNFRLGHVDTGIPSLETRKSVFSSVDERTNCNTCQIRHLCGGECYHRANTAGLGFFGVSPEECDTRRVLAPMIIDRWYRLVSDHSEIARRLTARRYTLLRPSEQAYAVKSLSEFAQLPHSDSK